jgi:sulfate transport system ATP-binding protein
VLDGGGRGATTTFAQRNLGDALVTFDSEAPLISYVRPHELEILGEAGDDTWAVTLSQTLTVGPNTRIEFKRVSDDSDVDVELPRERFTILRDRLGLAPGVQVHLRQRRVTRFGATHASADSAPPI